jgi:hypothetical protein
MEPTLESRLTADQQIARMFAEYPGFVVLHATPWSILWRGQLRPFERSYEVQIVYSAISLELAGIERFKPHVEVVQPVLAPRLAAPDVPIPHIFANKVFPERPRLCLYRLAEWTPTLYIADTIMLWTVEWLVGYECWRATGIWSAGGHGTERPDHPRRKNRSKDTGL